MRSRNSGRLAAATATAAAARWPAERSGCVPLGGRYALDMDGLDLHACSQDDLLAQPPRVALASVYPFRPREVVGPHQSASVLLIASYGGRGSIEWRAGRCVVEPGKLVLVPWACALRFVADARHPFRLLCVHLVRSMAAGLRHDEVRGFAAPKRPAALPTVPDPDHRWRDRLEMCERDFSHSGGPWQEALLHAWGLQLASSVAAALAQPRTIQDPQGPSALQACARWLERHPGQAYDRSALAHRAGLSPNHFSTAFRAVFGLSPRAYLNRCRMEEARRLLAGGGRRVGEVATVLGFQDPLWFSRVYRAHWGVPPSTHRRL